MKLTLSLGLVLLVVAFTGAPALAAGPSNLVKPLDRCIKEFYDPKTYDWLAFENDCGVDISVTFIFGNELGGNEMDLRAGRHDSTGRSRSEVASMGGYKFVICPIHFVPVDTSGHAINRTNKDQPFLCKPAW